MKKLPIKYLQIALVALIKDAGYDTDGFDVFPRVEVSGVEICLLYTSPSPRD